MKALFISKSLQNVSGAGVGARMHLNVLRKCIGNENVFVVDIDLKSKSKKMDNYVRYGKYTNKLSRIIRHLQGNTYLFSNKMINEICRSIGKQKIDFVFVDDSYYGNLIKKIKRDYPQVKVVSFFHDVKAALFKIWMKDASWIDKLDYKIGMNQEKISTLSVDANIVLNENENKLLKQNYGVETDYYFPVCVTADRPKDNNGNVDPFCTDKKHILFVGTYYLPNINGIHWFCDNVLPKINSEFDFWVVGKGLEKIKNDFTNENIHIIGFVDSIEEYYINADVVIAPLKDGGGMKIKTAEAISFGKYFIGSEESLYGYWEKLPQDIKNEVVYKCDTAQEYINALHKLSRIGTKKQNKKLVNIYDKYYSEKAACQTMKIIIENTTGRKL